MSPSIFYTHCSSLYTPPFLSILLLPYRSYIFLYLSSSTHTSFPQYPPTTLPILHLSSSTHAPFLTIPISPPSCSFSDSSFFFNTSSRFATSASSSSSFLLQTKQTQPHATLIHLYFYGFAVWFCTSESDPRLCSCLSYSTS